jgi:alpha-L-fucosidase
MLHRRIIASVLLSLLLVLCAFVPSRTRAQAGYQPTAGNLEARRWFQDAKFGLFIHWGV